MNTDDSLFTDIHVHYHSKNRVEPEKLIACMDDIGAKEIALISDWSTEIDIQRKNIKELLPLKQSAPNRIHLLAWIEPKITEVSELNDIIAMGYDGFKMIPNGWAPNEDWLFKYYEKIAELGVPCLFHSGILYLPTRSSKYCRPANYEDLIHIDGFKFILAHISWPWVDECIALWGQWRAMSREYNAKSEMYIDITPGTPPEYRKDALLKLLSFGAEDYVIFGTDNRVSSDWTPDRTKERWGFHIERDKKIFAELNIAKEVQNKIFNANFEKIFKQSNRELQNAFLECHCEEPEGSAS